MKRARRLSGKGKANKVKLRALPKSLLILSQHTSFELYGMPMIFASIIRFTVSLQNVPLSFTQTLSTCQKKCVKQSHINYFQTQQNEFPLEKLLRNAAIVLL
jgi:hypothetical protein